MVLIILFDVWQRLELEIRRYEQRNFGELLNILLIPITYFDRLSQIQYLYDNDRVLRGRDEYQRYREFIMDSNINQNSIIFGFPGYYRIPQEYSAEGILLGENHNYDIIFSDLLNIMRDFLDNNFTSIDFHGKKISWFTSEDLNDNSKNVIVDNMFYRFTNNKHGIYIHNDDNKSLFQLLELI